MATKTIVLVHGNFVNWQCWDDWVPFLKKQGYKVAVFRNPGRDATVPELVAAHPDPKVGELTIQQMKAALQSLIKEQPGEPIVIGHYFGGMLTQLMVNYGLTAAGVAIMLLRARPDASTLRALAWANIIGGAAGWVLLMAFWPQLDPGGRFVLGIASDAFIAIGVLELFALRERASARAA